MSCLSLPLSLKPPTLMAWIIAIASKQSLCFHFRLSRTIFHPTASVPLKIKKIEIKFNILFGIKGIKSHLVIKSSLYHGLDKGLHHLAPIPPWPHLSPLYSHWSLGCSVVMTDRFLPQGLFMFPFVPFEWNALPQSFHDWLLPFVQVLVQMTHSQKDLPIL